MTTGDALYVEFQMESLLHTKGLSVSRRRYKEPYDFLVNGKRVEIKCAELSGSGKSRLTSKKTNQKGFSRQSWKFNIHRHGSLNESHVDWYILRFEGIPGVKYSVCALVKSPIGKTTIQFSLRALISGVLKDEFLAFKYLCKNKEFPS